MIFQWLLLLLLRRKVLWRTRTPGVWVSESILHSMACHEQYNKQQNSQKWFHCTRNTYITSATDEVDDDDDDGRVVESCAERGEMAIKRAKRACSDITDGRLRTKPLFRKIEFSIKFTVVGVYACMVCSTFVNGGRWRQRRPNYVYTDYSK